MLSPQASKQLLTSKYTKDVPLLSILAPWNHVQFSLPGKQRLLSSGPTPHVCFIFCFLYFFPRTWVLVVSEYWRISCVFTFARLHTGLSNTLLPAFESGKLLILQVSPQSMTSLP